MVASRLESLLSQWSGNRDRAVTDGPVPDGPTQAGPTQAGSAQKATVTIADRLESAEADDLFSFIDQEFGPS